MGIKPCAERHMLNPGSLKGRNYQVDPYMGGLKLSFMEINDIQESARVLSVAMLDNPLHIAVLQGKGEKPIWIRMYAFMRNSVSPSFARPKYSMLKIDTCCGLHSFRRELEFKDCQEATINHGTGRAAPLETYTKPKKMVENPNFQAQRQNYT